MTFVRIHFRLIQDEDDYPPASVETLWAEVAPRADEYVIKNVPFFTREATIGDTVRAQSLNGQLWFLHVTDRSRNSLVRVIFFDEAARPRVSQALNSFGCATEYMRQNRLLSVSVPDRATMHRVRVVLQTEAGAGTLGYEEPILRD